jgi:phage/plasmid-associated DNA primase
MHRFENALPADLHLGAKLEREYPAILALILTYARQWYTTGLNAPACIVASTDAYFSAVDVFAQWQDKRCIREKGAFTPSNVLLVDFTEFAAGTDTEINTNEFAKKLTAAGFVAERRRHEGSGKVCGFVGLRLREHEEDNRQTVASRPLQTCSSRSTAPTVLAAAPAFLTPPRALQPSTAGATCSPTLPA